MWQTRNVVKIKTRDRYFAESVLYVLDLFQDQSKLRFKQSCTLQRVINCVVKRKGGTDMKNQWMHESSSLYLINYEITPRGGPNVYLLITSIISGKVKYVVTIALHEVGWLLDRLTDWLTDRLTETDWLRQTGWDRLAETDWLTDRLIDWPTDWQTDWVTDRQTGWQIDWLIDW
jgi:hypothetical protein